MNPTTRPRARLARALAVLGVAAAGIAVPATSASADPCQLILGHKICYVHVERIPKIGPGDPDCPNCGPLSLIRLRDLVVDPVDIAGLDQIAVGGLR